MILRELSEANGVSGAEDAVRAVVLRAIEPHVEHIRIDAMGGVTAIKTGTNAAGERLRVMLAAHMDEVGFIVTGIEGDGLLRFAAIGGFDDRILPGLRVRVGENALPGCIVWTPIHVNRDQNVVKLNNLRIDIGAANKDGAAAQVKRGDRIALDSYFAELGDTCLRGKAFDDRAGCAVLIDVLSGGSYPHDVLAAFTVQEEVGLRGALIAANALQPDVAFVLEGTPAADLPNPLQDADDPRELNPTTRLGAGPALTLLDRSLIVPPRLLAYLKETAAAHDIPFQYKSQGTGGTDGGAIHTALAGVPTAVISVPCRYIHSPTALLHRGDYAHAVRLVQAALNTLTRAALA